MAQIKIKHGEELLWYNTLVYESNGNPADLTGITAYSQMRTLPEGELVAEGICTVDAPHGTVTTLYTADVTENLKPSEYGFDVWLNANGQAVCIDTVEITVLGRYTEVENA